MKLFMLLISFGLFAAETDHFTHREMVLPDMSQVLNAKANVFLQEALEETNKTSDCSEKKLYKTLRKYFASKHSDGKFVKYILQSEEVKKDIIPLRDSVYREWNLTNGPVLGREKASKSSLALAPTIRVGDQVIGTDKFEHMFGMGFKYYRAHYQKGRDLETVLKLGILRERFILGGNNFTTGVFSYADLAANFNGMRFWNSLLQKKDDVFGKENNRGPYVECKSGKWVPIKAIDFYPFIDESMDESVNCSMFPGKRNLEKFLRALTNLGPDYRCPMNPGLRDLMLQKYGPLIINKFSSGIVPDLKDF